MDIMVRIAQFLAEILIVATVTESRAPVRDVNRATMAVTVNLVFFVFLKFHTSFVFFNRNHFEQFTNNDSFSFYMLRCEIEKKTALKYMQIYFL